MAVRANRKSKSQRILVPTTVHPHYRKVAAATAGNQGLSFEEVPYSPDEAAARSSSRSRSTTGRTSPRSSIQQPNFFGVLEDVDALTDWAHARNIAGHRRR